MSNLKICNINIWPLAVTHLDIILQVLLSGEQVPDLLIVDLQEGGLELVLPPTVLQPLCLVEYLADGSGYHTILNKKLNYFLCFKYLWYPHSTYVFRLLNNPCDFSNCSHKFKGLLCIEKQVLNSVLKDFLYTNPNNRLI